MTEQQNRLNELELEGLRRLAEYTGQDFFDYLYLKEQKEYEKLLEKEV